MQRGGAHELCSFRPDEHSANGLDRTDADKMAHLRAWYWSGGDMLELVRYQRQVLPKAASAEETVTSAAEIFRTEKTGTPSGRSTWRPHRWKFRPNSRSGSPSACI